MNTKMKKEKSKPGNYSQTDDSGAKDPMSTEKIALQEPTAVKRDKNQRANQFNYQTSFYFKYS